MDTRPVIKRFEIVVLKDKGGATNPKEQVPAAAQVDFYRQGATVKVGGPVPGPITVYNRGALVAGDQVKVNLSAVTLTVDPPQTNDPVNLLRLSGGPTSLAQWDRLVPTGSRPIPAQASGPPASSGSFINTSSTDGRGSCYIAAYRWDYIVSGTGLATRLFIDAEGSFVMR